MDKSLADELHGVPLPIVSLINKSEKAQKKLPPGTWQHTMLQNNIDALKIASALIAKNTGATNKLARRDLKEALDALTAMIDKEEKARSKFSRGTPQHTLQENRLKALRIAEAFTKVEMHKREA